MKDYIAERVVVLANYMIDTKATVRQTAKKSGISKLTVHKDVACRLKSIDYALYKKVKPVLEENKAERHLRGGMATKEKYLQSKAI